MSGIRKPVPRNLTVFPSGGAEFRVPLLESKRPDMVSGIQVVYRDADDDLWAAVNRSIEREASK